MTQRLLGYARQHWVSIDGEYAPLDPLDLPFDRFLNLTYVHATRDMDPAAVRRFDLRLWVPPPGDTTPAQGPWSAEAETAAFKAVKNALGMRDPVPGKR